MGPMTAETVPNAFDLTTSRGRLRAYLGGWWQYYRHGQSARVFVKLDRFVRERVARHLARSQPKGRGRKRRSWRAYQDWLEQERVLPPLAPWSHAPQPYRGRAKVRWRAV